MENCPIFGWRSWKRMSLDQGFTSVRYVNTLKTKRRLLWTTSTLKGVCVSFISPKRNGLHAISLYGLFERLFLCLTGLSVVYQSSCPFQTCECGLLSNRSWSTSGSSLRWVSGRHVRPPSVWLSPSFLPPDSTHACHLLFLLYLLNLCALAFHLPVVPPVICFYNTTAKISWQRADPAPQGGGGNKPAPKSKHLEVFEMENN